MSKSKGNVIDPAEVTKKYGAEILRLWVAYEDYGTDVSVSDEMFQRVSETYRRIRNTMRYLLGNLGDFSQDKDAIDFKDMPPIDQWALYKLNSLIETCTKAYDSYDFFKVYHALNVFFTVDLSAVYLDVLKDRMYTGHKNGLRRRSSQTVFFQLITRLSELMAPILTFLAEEVNDYLPGTKSESIFLRNFPKAILNPEQLKTAMAITQKMEKLFLVREVVAKSLEDLRRDKVIGSSLDAEVILKARGETYSLLKDYASREVDEYRTGEVIAATYLRELLIVSDVTVVEDLYLKEEFSATVTKASGQKCPRCWHYSISIGQDSSFADICKKCVQALKI